MTALERLKARLSGASEEELLLLLEDAEGMILSATGRSCLPRALITAQVQLAAVLYNRSGTEGETAHSEGGVSRTMAGMPEEIWRQIAPHRVAKVVSAHAAP